MSKGNISSVGTSWAEFEKEVFTPEQIAESDLRVAIIGELIKARQEKGITQEQLGHMSGIKQPVIARLESGTTNPQIGTVMKLLYPLGKKLVISDI